MLTRCLLLLLSLAVMPAGAGNGTQSLRVAVISGRAAPFAAWQGDRLVGGIDLALGSALGSQLRLRVEPVVLPRQRIRGSAIAGEFDLVCGYEATNAAETNAFDWSPALAEIPELLIGTRRAEPVDRVLDLVPGREIGTLLGLDYPLLEGRFADGSLVRADALDEERLMRKLLAERHPYAVLNAVTLRELLQESELAAQQLAGWRLPIGRQSYRCGVPTAGRVPAPRMWEALEALRPQLTGLLAKALTPPLAVVVSAQSALRSLDRHELVDLYLGRRARLAGGEAPRLTMLRGGERQLFIEGLLQREAAEYQAAWAARQFGGRQRAPDELRDVPTMKARLKRDPGAIGYVPLSQVDADLRVVYAH